MNTKELTRDRNRYARLSHRCYLYFLGKLTPDQQFELGYDLAKITTSAELKKRGIKLSR